MSHAAAQQGQRIHEIQATVAPWRGTPAQLVRVLSRAADLLTEENDQQPTVWVEAQYHDGRDLFQDMPALEAAAATLPIHRLAGFSAVLDTPAGDRISFQASRKIGARLKLESRREVFALGARDVLERMLRENREDRFFNRLVIVGLTVSVGLIFASVIADRYGSRGSTLDQYLIGGSLVSSFLFLGLGPFLAVRGPRLILLSVEQASSSEPGPMLRLQSWIQRHPVIGLILVFAMGIATNEVADLI